MNCNPIKRHSLIGLALVVLALPALAADDGAGSQRAAETGQVIRVQLEELLAEVQEDACVDQELAVTRVSGDIKLVAHADCGLTRVLWRQVR